MILTEDASMNNDDRNSNIAACEESASSASVPYMLDMSRMEAFRRSSSGLFSSFSQITQGGGRRDSSSDTKEKFNDDDDDDITDTESHADFQDVDLEEAPAADAPPNTASLEIESPTEGEELRRRKKKLCFAMVPLFFAIVFVAILIPAVLLKKHNEANPNTAATSSSSLSSPSSRAQQWTSASVFPGTVMNENQQLDGLPASTYYGDQVRLSANGKRMVVTSLQNEGIVQVWDYEPVVNEYEEWILKAQFLPREDEDEDDGWTPLNTGGALLQPHSLAMNQDGSRIILSTTRDEESLVRVYQDETGDGTSWIPVGNDLDADYFYRFLYNLYVVEDDELPHLLSNQAVAMSRQGDVIAVSASPTPASDLATRSGAILRVFQHITATPDAALAREQYGVDRVWIPLGQALLLEQGEVLLSDDIILSDDGRRLIMATTSSSEPSQEALVKIYDLNEQQPLWLQSQEIVVDTGNVSNLLFSLSLSPDGSVLAISFGTDDDYSTSLGSSTYGGSVDLYQYNRDTAQFESVYQLLHKDNDNVNDMDKAAEASSIPGSPGAIALTADYTLFVAMQYYSSTKDAYSTQIQAFRYIPNGGIPSWQALGSAFGNEHELSGEIGGQGDNSFIVSGAGWQRLAVSDDASRVVAAAPYHSQLVKTMDDDNDTDNNDNGDLGTSEVYVTMGGVAVFDFAGRGT